MDDKRKWLYIVLVIATFAVATGCDSSSDDANRIRMTLPDGWVQDYQMLEFAREGSEAESFYHEYVAGISITPGFSDPSISIVSAEAPQGISVREIADVNIADMERYGFEFVRRYSSSVAGYSAEVVIFDMSPPNPAPGVSYATESNTEVTFFVRQPRYYVVQCTAVYARSVAELDLCRDAVKTLEFYK
jgi:hypothetical protein